MITFGIIIYILILFALGVYSAYQTSSEKTIIGGRQVGLIGTSASAMVGLCSGGGVLAVIGMVLLDNYSIYWLILGTFFSMILLGTLAPRIRRAAHRHNWINITDIFSSKAGKFSTSICAIILLILCVLMSSAQLFAVGSIINSITDIPYQTCVIVVGGCIGFYLILGGYRTLIWSDIVQFLIMIILAVSAYSLYFTSPEISLTEDFVNREQTESYLISIGTTVFILLTITGRPDIWQRIFSAQNGKIARQSFIGFTCSYYFYALGLIALGIYMSYFFPDITKETFLSVLYSQENNINNIFLSFVCLGILAASMSTIDSQFYIAATAFLKNVLRINNESERKKFIKYNRFMILAVASLSIICSFFVKDIVSYLFNTAGITVIFVPPLLYCLLKAHKPNKTTDLIIALSLITGLTTFLVLFITDGFDHFWWNCLPALISAITMALGLFFNQLKKSHSITTNSLS